MAKSKTAHLIEIASSEGDFWCTVEGKPVGEDAPPHVVCVDIKRWMREHPGVDPRGLRLDILEVGYWYDAVGGIREPGYEEPELDFLRERIEGAAAEFADSLRDVAKLVKLASTGKHSVQAMLNLHRVANYLEAKEG